MCRVSTSEICSVQGPFTWVAHYKRAKLLQTCSKTLTYRQRREGRQLSNKINQGLTHTVSCHQRIKTPMYSFKGAPNGYIGLYLIKVVHNISVCGKVRKGQRQTTQLQIHLEGLKRLSDRRRGVSVGYQGKETRAN